MSDISASHCGCDRPQENNGCGGILWLIILLCICGNGSSGSNGCGMNFCGGGEGGCESIIWILILLSCCGGGSFC